MIPGLNTTLRAWDDYQTSLHDGSDAAAQLTLEAAFKARNADWIKKEVKMYNINKNKVLGDTPSPRKRKASVAFAGDESSVVELQKIRTGIFALVEIGRSVSVALRMRDPC